jgi:hypothetical protein
MPKETIATNQQATEANGTNLPPWRFSVGWHHEGNDVQVGAGIDDDYESGQFFHLDRHEINRLIRTLRKARDAAFGSDA